MPPDVIKVVVLECFVIGGVVVMVFRNKSLAEHIAAFCRLGPPWVLLLRAFLYFMASLWVTVGVVNLQWVLVG